MQRKEVRASGRTSQAVPGRPGRENSFLGSSLEMLSSISGAMRMLQRRGFVATASELECRASTWSAKLTPKETSWESGSATERKSGLPLRPDKRYLISMICDKNERIRRVGENI